MKDQFTRTRYVLGSSGVERLAAAHVCVFGIGGVGGFAVEALARAGVGALTLVDKDVVDVTNINRQVIATHATVGRPKVEVMAERIAQINPACAVTPLQLFYLPQERERFDFGSFDYVVDAVDNVTAKLDLAQAVQEAGTPFISSMGTGNKLDPTRLQVGDVFETSICKLAKVMRKELRKRGVASLRCVYSTEPARTPLDENDEPASAPGSVSFVPSVAGLIIAGEVVRALTGAQPLEEPPGARR